MSYNRRPVDNLDGVENTYDDNGRLIPDGVADPGKASNSQDLIHNAALSFIKKNAANRFFLYYATQLPHGPCITPDLSSYKDKDWDLKHKEWAAMMAHMDRGVGQMVSLLDELGILENTIIFFAGDNGYSQYGYMGREKWLDDPLFRNKGPWRAGKFICRDGGMRVPFFVYYKGKIPARESSRLCALYDFLATAADLAGVRLQHETDGISLVPELENNPHNQQEHEYLYWESGTLNPHGQAIRLGPWSAYREHPSKPTELYRIDTDMSCTADVANDNPDIVQEIERIFAEAHENSEWYINPGESNESIELKRKKAEDMGCLQVPTKANTTFTRK